MDFKVVSWYFAERIEHRQKQIIFSVLKMQSNHFKAAKNSKKLLQGDQEGHTCLITLSAKKNMLLVTLKHMIFSMLRNCLKGDRIFFVHPLKVNIFFVVL